MTVLLLLVGYLPAETASTASKTPMTAAPVVDVPHVPADIVATPWVRPETLHGSLDQLASSAGYGGWAREVIATLDRLEMEKSLGSAGSRKAIDQLDQLIASGKTAFAILRKQAPTEISKEADLTRFALERRARVWRCVVDTAAKEGDRAGAMVSKTDNMIAAIGSVEFALVPHPNRQAWRTFFLLNELRTIANHYSATEPAERRKLARVVLDRLVSPQYTHSQWEMVQGRPYQNLRRELRIWASEPLDYCELLRAIEGYEKTTATTEAASLSKLWQKVRWSAHAPDADLGEIVDRVYRNANVRFTVSGNFINRMLPEMDTIEAPVNDRILDLPVHGSSQTSTRLRVGLIPDKSRWRIGLGADGDVHSSTTAQKGQFTFFNQGYSRFNVRKFLLIDPLGVRAQQTEVGAVSQSHLSGMQSNYDAIPLLGSLIRDAARSQHDSKKDAANREVEYKVAYQARERFDAEVIKQLKKANSTLQTTVFDPLAKLQLTPEVIDLYTTQKDLVARYRLAGGQQMGAFSPRPPAPLGSHISCQIHQSAMNNVIEKMGLDGETYELTDLYKKVMAAFKRPDAPIPDDMPEDVVLKFAPKEAIRVACRDGAVVLTIQLDELKTSSKRWRKLKIEARYERQGEGLTADLVRNGTIFLRGYRLRLRDQIALRGIFNKALSTKNAFPLVNGKLKEDPRLKGLEVTQCFIEDGWIGLALGDKPARGPKNTTLGAQKTPAKPHYRVGQALRERVSGSEKSAASQYRR